LRDREVINMTEERFRIIKSEQVASPLGSRNVQPS